MAASQRFSAVIAGRGGHGAMPHLARDPVVAAAMAVVALQPLVSRQTSPLDAAVVTVGQFNTGGPRTFAAASLGSAPKPPRVASAVFSLQAYVT